MVVPFSGLDINQRVCMASNLACCGQLNSQAELVFLLSIPFVLEPSRPASARLLSTLEAEFCSHFLDYFPFRFGYSSYGVLRDYVPFIKLLLQTLAHGCIQRNTLVQVTLLDLSGWKCFWAPLLKVTKWCTHGFPRFCLQLCLWFCTELSRILSKAIFLRVENTTVGSGNNRVYA